jgi:outer membrane protein TolC
MNIIVLSSFRNFKTSNMKNTILLILLLFLPGVLIAQQRDLNFYLEQAKINSPLINKNKNENIIIELDLKQIKSILSKPEVNLESNILFAPIISHDNNSNHFEWASDGADNYSGYDLALTDGGHYQAFVSVKQPLLTGSQYRIYSNKADISHKINENSIALSIHELEQLVNYQYILCLKSREQSQISSDLVKELKNQLLIMQKLVENAIYKQTDLMLLQIEYQNYEVESGTFQAEYQNNLYDLNLICGISDKNLVEVQEINFQIKSDILVNSQFLTSYKLDSLNIITEQLINELKYKPQVSLFADAGLNAAYLPSLNRLGFSSGITFSWNIFNGNQREIQREKSTINLQTIEFEKKNFITQNDINKNKILNQINSIDQRLKIIEEQIDQYDQLYNAYSKELSQGEVSVIDFKNVLKDIFAKKQEGLLLKMDKQLLINSYNYWNY